MKSWQRLVGSALFLVSSACGDSSSEGGGGAGGESAVGPTVAAPGGFRRLTGSQLRYSLEYLLGSEAAAEFVVWSDPQLHGFESIAAAELALSANDVSTLETAVYMAIDRSLSDPTHVGAFAPCVESAPTTACYDEVAAKFGRVAWRRMLDADEQARLAAIGAQAQTWGGGDFDTGLRYELAAILQSPNFIYIEEIGEGDGAQRKLTPHELAARMSFFLLHRVPDVALLDAADAGKLATDEGVRDEARRLLRQPEARRSLDRFFSELYLIRDITDVSKDAATFPQWNGELAAAMQEEMLRFLQDVVWTRNADAREIFTSTDTFVDATMAGFYGLPAPASGWQKTSYDAGQGRFGLLGKAGFLARFAHPKMTSPTRRGRFIRERILCREIPPPPPGVNQNLPEPDHPQTMRERLAAHSETPSCGGCHSLIDPVGLAFEHFDPVGQWREKDNGLAIETAGHSAELDFTGPEDLASAAADLSGACFVKNFWRESLGHVETEGEAPALGELEERFVASGYSLQELMVEMTVSEGFQKIGAPK